MKKVRQRGKKGILAEFPVGIAIVLLATVVSVFLLADTALVMVYKLKLAVAAGTIAADVSYRPNYDLLTGTASTWTNFMSGWNSKMAETLQDNCNFYAGQTIGYLGLPGVTMNGGLPIQLDTAGGNILRTFKVPVAANVPLLITGLGFIPNSTQMQENGGGAFTIDEFNGAVVTITAPQSNLPYNASVTPSTFGGNFVAGAKAYQSSFVGGITWYPGIAAPPSYTVTSGSPCVTTIGIPPPVANWLVLNPVD